MTTLRKLKTYPGAGVVLVAALLGFCLSARPTAWAQGGAIHGSLPTDIDTAAHYVFYLHGRIIEDEGVRPTHPQFGVYEYEAILEALAAGGFEVVSEVRPPGADGMEYARRTALQVRRLLAAGVPAEQITVVGFSKGGAIAILASWELQEPDVSYVWLAACNDWAFRMSALVPTGRVLSIHEASDSLGVSCEPLFVRSDLIEGEEIRIETGEGHGAFYRPIPEWIKPATEWIRKQSERGQRDEGGPPEELPDWVGALGYERSELFPIHTGSFGYPYVLVVVNGVPLDLPFDTGNMVGLSLRREEIEPLGLRPADTWDRLSSDGRVVGTYSSYSGATVEVWRETWPDQTIYELDDPELPGLIGPQQLLGRRYTLDYEAGLMAISTVSTPADLPGMEAIALVESSRNPGLVLFYGSVHGRRVLIQADTGKSRSTVDPELAQELGLTANDRGFRIDDLHIGSRAFRISSAKEVSLRAIDESLDDPILLGIGSDILGQIPVTVDYIGGRILLPTVTARAPSPAAIARSPVALVREN